MNEEEHSDAFEYSRTEEIIMGIMVVVMIISCVLSQVLGFLRLPILSSIGWIGGGLLFIFGLVLAIVWASLWSKEYQGQLITHGVYRYIRHPHYLSAVLLFIGISLFFRSIISLALATYLSIAIVRGIKEEEEHLLKQYGDSYVEYMQETRWRFIPMIY